MQRNPNIRRGLERAGFTGGWLSQPFRHRQPSTSNGDASGGSSSIRVHVARFWRDWLQRCAISGCRGAQNDRNHRALLGCGPRGRGGRGAAARISSRTTRNPGRGSAAALDRGARKAADCVRRRNACPTSASSAIPGCRNSPRSMRSSRSTRTRAPLGIDATDYFQGFLDSNRRRRRALRRALVRRHAAALYRRDLLQQAGFTRRRDAGPSGRTCWPPSSTWSGRSDIGAAAASTSSNRCWSWPCSSRRLLRDDGRTAIFAAPTFAARSSSTRRCSSVAGRRA